MKREIHADLLGLGRLLKGVQYLLFPAAAGIDLVRDVVEAAAEAQAGETLAGERSSQGRQENAEQEGVTR